jgi:hypothetical protein
MTTAAVWAFRGLWATLPLTAGPTFAAALDPTSSSFQTTASLALWLVWLAVLAASLVPRSATLTPVRIAAPAAPAAVVWAALSLPDIGGAEVLAITATVAAAAVVLTAWVGEEFIDGDSYGNEHRTPLRVPGPLVLGPIQLAWAAAVAGLATGPALLAAGVPVWGGIALVIGLPAAFVAVRALHALTQRFLVFVPGGLVVHDPTALAEPVLLRKNRLMALGPAPADSDALDLTQRAFGLALEIRLAEPVSLTLVQNRARAQEQQASRILIAPSRPGSVVARAAGQ